MEKEKSNTANETLEGEIYTHKMMHFLREPAIRVAIQQLNLPMGSRGLDAGCGIGLITK